MLGSIQVTAAVQVALADLEVDGDLQDLEVMMEVLALQVQEGTALAAVVVVEEVLVVLVAAAVVLLKDGIELFLLKVHWFYREH